VNELWTTLSVLDLAALAVALLYLAVRIGQELRKEREG
jgi:hypothetical protein